MIRHHSLIRRPAQGAARAQDPAQGAARAQDPAQGAARAQDPARRRLLDRSESGVALVEFALVVGIFVMVLYGLVYFGMALATKQRVTNAAAEGARAAVGAASDADAQTIAQTRVQNLLGAGSGTRYTVTPVAAPCNTAAPTGPKCITVTVTYDWENHPVVPAAPGLNLAPIDSFGSTASVQYSG